VNVDEGGDGVGVVRQADPRPVRGEDGHGVGVGVEDDDVIAVPVEHRLPQDRNQRGVQDLQGVDGEPGGLAGGLGLSQGAGDAEQVAGLYVGQQRVSDARVCGGALTP
jgi:hypothetical protein